MKPGVSVLAKGGLSKLSLEVGNGRTSIAIATQIRVTFVRIGQETFVGHLYEAGTTA